MSRTNGSRRKYRPSSPHEQQSRAVERAKAQGTEYTFSAGPPVVVLGRPQLHIHKAKHKGMVMHG